MIGLTAAMMLAADGHQVTVLEADPDGAPAPAPATDAWGSWKRGGVAQFHQPGGQPGWWRRAARG